jgi:hypothetical protein
MSQKNSDKKNRFRSVTIAFRMSPEENKELDNRVKLSGKRTRQEYLIEAVLKNQIVSVGNPQMFVQFRKQLLNIETELKRINSVSEIDEEMYTTVSIMLEILQAFESDGGD